MNVHLDDRIHVQVKPLRWGADHRRRAVREFFSHLHVDPVYIIANIIFTTPFSHRALSSPDPSAHRTSVACVGAHLPFVEDVVTMERLHGRQ